MPDSQRQVGWISIKLNGRELAPDVISSLDEVVVEDDLAQPAMFALRFNDPQFKLLDGDLFRLGTEVKLSAADAAGKPPKPILTGEVTALETVCEQHNIVLVVRGYDRSHRLHRGSKTRSFLKQSDGDIAGVIARQHSLHPDIEISGLKHEYVIQSNQTDMQFLRARAARIGYQVVVDDQKLRFRRAEESPPRAPAQAWGVTLLALRARLTTVAQPNEVQVRGWDAQVKRPIVGTARRPAQPSQVGDGANGGQAAERAFGGPATVVVTDQPVRTQSEADQLAQATLDELSGDYLSAEGACLGEPAIRAGALVELTGVGARLGGTYFVTASRHRYTPAEGYMTNFYVSGRRATGLLAAIDAGPTGQRGGVVVGIVTDNNDPLHLGRVKLRFPWLDDSHESDWARLVSPGAGAERGLLAVPEIDDEVLVAFEQGDPSRPYVLGGLWNGKDHPPRADAVQSGRVQVRTLKTRAGHTIELHDDGGITIESKGTLDIRGTGGRLSIGQSGVELSAKGTLKIKGQLVKINCTD